MATSPKNGVIEHLHRATMLWDGTGLTDGQLLTVYVTNQDEAALAALVQRHGPMVWNVCRRVLGNHHDAEDAFQASFLVFVRRSASIASRELLANWLYGVAHQTALKARATVAKRTFRERQVKEMPEPAVVERGLWNDLLPLLDQELSRLHDSYRVVIILCDLEGKTRKEVARQLGVPEGTVASRLARARVMLAKRFIRHGLVVSGGAFAAAFAKNVVSASMPNMVATSTIKAARLFAAGQATAAGVISPTVAALTEGVLKAMFIKKILATTMVVLAVSVMAITGGSLAIGQTEGTGKPVAEKNVKLPAAEKPVEPAVKQEKEPFTAWGREVGGLQAGIGFPLDQKRVYSHGETINLVIRLRNVGKEGVEFKHIWAFFVENPPKITDVDGKRVQLPGPLAEGLHLPRNTNVAPGKEVELHEWKLDLMPTPPRFGRNMRIATLYGTGKFSVQCEQIVGPTSANPNHPNPTFKDLATGKLELEVKEVPAGKQKVLTPDEAIRMASDSKLTREFNESKPAVEFKVQFVTKAIIVRAADKKDAGWDHGHSPDDVCLGTLVPSSPIKAEDPLRRNHTRFVATLTAKAIKQLNKAGIADLEKHFKGTTIRVTGSISRRDYDGLGSPAEFEIVIDDLSQFEVVK